MDIRKLNDDDRAIVVAFLEAHAADSMFLLSNIARCGLIQPDRPYGGDYWGAFDGGAFRGVIAQMWNGNVMMQAPEKDVLDALASGVRNSMERRVAGLLGPDDQACAVMSAFALEDADYASNSAERLFQLDPDRLIMPPSSKDVAMTAWQNADPALMTRWLVDYNLEALGATPGVELETGIRLAVSQGAALERFVLLANGVPVALAGFNASYRVMKQLGPVWTPPLLRGRGYARQLVALMVREAFDQGAEQMILFTNSPAAARAYQAVGFAQIGRYRLALLATPVSVS
ncbi:GNAT family N-acetyltransferase [Martelella alba]|uniref:GNAT family N-acetyltransferase n=1 Tax=Martelella alba TaxID=2590451 RepID=A0A506UE62_9HYPH|nr:GNAT family N-acetyltransferase [Martelella alba]TPW31421.1 GNAT family N-acetyltransferase [Martelella alba]